MNRRKEIHRPGVVFKVSLQLARELLSGEEKEGRDRGRPNKYPGYLYIALLALRYYFNWTYRETKGMIKGICNKEDITCPSYQSLHRHMKNKVKIEQPGVFLNLLKEKLQEIIQSDNVFIIDSTGISSRGKDRKLKWRRGEENRIVRNHSRLCLITLYSFSNRLLLSISAVVGESYSPGPVLAVNALSRVKERGILIGDRGFDAAMVYDAVKDKFTMVVKLKKSGRVRDPIRKEAEKRFCPLLYRLRSVSEGVFGGIKKRLNGNLRSFIPEISRKEAFFLVIAYRFRVYITTLLFLIALVSIIMPVFNKVNLTRRCVESILKTPPSISFEIVIADDHSQDGTGDYLTYLSRRYDFVKTHRNSENKGGEYGCCRSEVTVSE